MSSEEDSQLENISGNEFNLEPNARAVGYKKKEA